METYQFPESFLFGTATASLQIEGGDRNNNWFRFCEGKGTKDGSHCIVADDHWNRYEQDIGLIKHLNQDVYRMSIEWSRIEPQQGVFNSEALEHYHAELQMLVDNGIRPLVTLHHFSNPIWLEDLGGWANPAVVDWYLKYVDKAVSTLGDLVAEWVTINEPNVYVEGTYSSCIYPGSKPGLGDFFKASRNMIVAHVKAYKLIHKLRREAGFLGKTLVGVAHHLRVFDGSEGGFMAGLPVKLLEHSFHDLFLEGTTNGRLLFPIGFGGLVDEKGTYSDFLGINYYSRDMIRFKLNPARVFADLKFKEGMPVNDMGWEIYPEGLYTLCKRYWDRYGLPIFITENGICDRKDEQRTQFIYDHLRMVAKLIDDGVVVQRYYHWSLMDNFEWVEGLNERFGIIEVNYETLERTIRRSGQFYGEVAAAKGVSSELLGKYFDCK